MTAVEAPPQVVYLAGAWGDEIIDRARAMALLRCDDAALDQLVDDGLPCWGDDSVGWRLGYCDVMNAGLYQGSRFTVAAVAERYLVQFAREDPSAWIAPRDWLLTIRTTCAAKCRGPHGADLAVPEHACLVDPADRWSLVVADDGSVSWRLPVRAEGSRDCLVSPTLRDIYATAFDGLHCGSIRYQYLPPALRRDAGATQSLGIGDCLSVGLHLRQIIRQAGIVSRLRRGYLLGLMPIEHVWIETLDADGRFKPIDPVLAALAARSASVGSAGIEFFAGSRPANLLPWPGYDPLPIFGTVCDHPGSRANVSAEPGAAPSAAPPHHQRELRAQ